jgi:uncharacterized protein YuzE
MSAMLLDPTRRAVRRTPTLMHDQRADALVVSFADEPIEFSRQLDPDRRIDFDGDGRVVAVAFERVSWGVELSDLPSRLLVARLLAEHCVKTIV